MGRIVGVVRMLVIGLVLVGGTGAIVLLGWLPRTWRGGRPGGWIATGMARTFLRVFDVRLHCADRERLATVHGFIFPNHNSYLDVILLMSIAPMRFLAKAEVGAYPFIGRIARSIDTVFVDRSDKTSRHEAREALSRIALFPPVVIFPEGKIVGDNRLHPFRYGAFELAVQHRAPYLPAVFIYSDYATAAWGDEPLLRAVWRLACHRGPLTVHLDALHTVHPLAGESAERLALAAYGAMQAVLDVYGGFADQLVEPGL